MENNQLAAQNGAVKKNLPVLQDLYADLETAAKNNDLNILLNQPPKPQWIKQNKFANNSNYIPIEKIEYLLTSIFTKWRVEVKQIQVIANSVVVTIRLYYMDPITLQWDWQDGIGAQGIQTAQGASATDFTQVTANAVQMAAPAAESYAIKDAAEKLGKLFGKDINRRDVIEVLPNMEKKAEIFKDKLEKLKNKES